MEAKENEKMKLVLQRKNMRQQPYNLQKGQY